MKNLLKKFSIFAIFLNGIDSAVKLSKFSAVSDIPYADKLYQTFRNGDPPSNSDPAALDARIRQRICEDVTNSGFFEWFAMEPVKLNNVRTELTRTENLDIFRQIYTPTTHRLKRLFYRYEYSNPYTVRLIEVRDPATKSLYRTEEHVFVCLLRKRWSNDLVPFYVSKEYNLSVGEYQAARFVFGEQRFVVLAEKCGRAHTKPKFKIELHYLETRRKYRSQLSTDCPESDPVLRLISKDPERNQHYRLCTSVLSSSYFRTKFKYPYRVNAYTFFEDSISFKTSEANLQAGDEVYREWLVVCPVREVGTNHQTRVYISRAYESERVFVYLRDKSDGNVYLEKLISNVSIVQENVAYISDDVE